MKNFIQCLILTTCLVLIARHFMTHHHELALITEIPFKSVVTLLFLLFLLNFILFYKTHLVLINFGIKNLSTLNWLKIFIISRCMNFFVSQSANIYRALILKRSYDFSYTKFVSLTVFNSWFELITLFMISFASALIFHFALIANHFFLIVFLLISTIGLLSIGPFLTMKFLLLWKNPHFRINWIINQLKDLNIIINKHIKNHKMLGSLMMLSILTFLLTILAVKTSFSALNLDLSPNQLILFTIIMLMSRQISILPGNLGLTEIICGYSSDILGYSIGSGVIVSSLIRITDFLIISFPSLFFYKLFIKTIRYQP